MADYQSLLREFSDKKLRYLIVGGVAVNLHGYPRSMHAHVWGLDVPVVSIDDLIAMKQHSDREKDIQDVVALLELKGL